jgi:cbb3-type cytochrome oxidase maturation protein
MDMLYLLVPMSVLLVLGLLVLFAWALRGGQFDDLEREGVRILGTHGTTLDVDQGGGEEAAKQSPHRPPPSEHKR